MASSSSSRVLKRADPTTIEDKFLVGYQGWFTCPGDGRPVHNGHHGWLHWFNKPLPDGGKPTIDLWPDVSDYTPDELFPVPWYTTSVPPSSSSSPCTCSCSPDSEPHYHPQLFSSRHPKTVRRHFNWMAQVGVDGVFLQRFAGQCCPIPSSHSPDHHHHHPRHGTAKCDIMHLRDEVTSVVRSAAEHEGRVWAIMYDVSGVPDDEIEAIIKADWTHLMRDLKILESGNYLREEGRVVLALWGFGFSNRGHSPQTIRRITQFIRSVTPGGAYIMAGTPTHWATLRGDADPNPEFFEMWFDEFDAISPWTVGRYSDEDGIDRFAKEKLVGDLKKIGEVERDRERHGRSGVTKTMDYVPVIFPGSSGFNLSHGKWAFNEQPRDGGRLLWRQIYQVKRLVLGEGSHADANLTDSERAAGRSKRRRIVYGAMWDEYDEGTAFLPVVSKKRELPREGKFLALDSDGYDLPPDWYMRIAGFIGESVRGERGIGETFPVKDLQDYWSSHPKYEILPEPVASSVPGPPSSSTATASGSGSGGGNGGVNEEGSAGVEAQAQSFDEWCAQEGKGIEDVPPPPYTLEPTGPQPVPVSVSSTAPSPVQVNQTQQTQEQPPVPTQTRPSSQSTASIAPNASDGSAPPPIIPLQSRPSIASRPASHSGSAPYPGLADSGPGPGPPANTSNANAPYRVYSSSRPSRPGTAVVAGGGGAGGALKASQPSQPNWNTRPQVQGGPMGELDERFGRQSLFDAGPISSRPPVTPTSPGAASQWPPAEWSASGQQSPSSSPSYPIQSRPSSSSHHSYSQPHSPAFPQSSLASPPLPPPRPSSSGHSPSATSGYAHRPPPPPAHPASRPTLSARPSTSPRPPASPRPPPPPSPSSRPHPSAISPGPGMPSSPGPGGFTASTFPQPYGHAQESAYPSAYSDVTQGYVNAGNLGAGMPSPTGGGPGYGYSQGYGYGYGAGSRYAGTGYEEGAGGFYAGPSMPLGPGPGRPSHHGGPGSGMGSGPGGFPAVPPPMPARPQPPSHDIQHMPSISPGQIMPGTSPHHPSGATSATTPPASISSSVPAPPSGSGGFVPGGGAGVGRFGDFGSKLSSTGQKILPPETWKRVEGGIGSLSSAGSKMYQKFSRT